MTLKAVLFEFNGIILDDTLIHQALVEQILLEENLRPQPDTYRNFCLGRSDRACLQELLTSRGRVATEAYLEVLIARKAMAYRRYLESLELLPLFPGLEVISVLRAAELKLAIVSGALRSEIKAVLNRAELLQYFPVIVAGDDAIVSKPEPDGYLLAVQRLNDKYPALDLKPAECLAVEDTFAGIAAAKRAGVPAVAVANTYPFHMLQRQADWTVDSLVDLELDRVQEVFKRFMRLAQ